MIEMESTMRGRLSVGTILGAAATLIRTRPMAGAITLIALAGGGAVVDMTVTESGPYNLANLVLSICGLVAQFIVLDRLLRAEGLIDQDDGPRGGAFVMLAIATGLGIALGLVLLIIPGLLLAARWAVALPAVIGRRVSAREAMAASAEMTREDIPALSIASAILLVPSIAAIAMSVLLYPEEGDAGLAYVLATNVTLYVGQVLGWYASVAIYALYRHSEPTLEEVFA